MEFGLQLSIIEAASPASGEGFSSERAHQMNKFSKVNFNIPIHISFGVKLLSIGVESNGSDGEKSRNNLSMVDPAILVSIVIAISNGKHRCDFSIREFLVGRT